MKDVKTRFNTMLIDLQDIQLYNIVGEFISREKALEVLQFLNDEDKEIIISNIETAVFIESKIVSAKHKVEEIQHQINLCKDEDIKRKLISLKSIIEGNIKEFEENLKEANQ